MEEGINLILNYKGKAHLKNKWNNGPNPHMSRLPEWVDFMAG